MAVMLQRVGEAEDEGTAGLETLKQVVKQLFELLGRGQILQRIDRQYQVKADAGKKVGTAHVLLFEMDLRQCVSVVGQF